MCVCVKSGVDFTEEDSVRRGSVFKLPEPLVEKRDVEGKNKKKMEVRGRGVTK